MDGSGDNEGDAAAETAIEGAAPDETAPDAAWHRRQAMLTYNRTWELIDSHRRDPATDQELLRTAFASRHHWEMVGSDREFAIGDWLIAHVAALLALPELSLRYATAALQRAEAGGWKGWILASMHEGMARACAAAGDRSGRDRHVALARAALATETDAEDRALIESQVASVP